LWSSVRDDIAGEAVEVPDISEEEFHCSLGCDGCVSLNEVSPLSYQVHCYHNHVISMSLQQFYYKVNPDCPPPFIWDVERLEFTEGPMSLGLCLKAEIASAAILTYVS
jgi:hypothetical protein